MAHIGTPQGIPMTVNGKKQLDAELKKLKSVSRPAVIKAIEVAREHGDLSENAEYKAAKEQQGFIEGRIQEITSKLASAQVIDPTQIKSETIVFGATVVLEDSSTGNEVTYQIVGEDESDLKQKKISISAPLARALIGKRSGDEVLVKAPKGVMEYDVIEVRYG